MVKLWERYWHQPISAVRPYLFAKGFLVCLALDLLVSRVRHTARYGADGFNVAHFAWLDAIQPSPTAALQAGVLVLAALLALVAALVRFDRIVVAAAFLLHTWGWSMSMLDTYQHHYLLSVILACLVFFPEPRRADVSSAGKPVRIHAWAYVLLAATAAIVYTFTSVAKMDGEWLGGHVLAVVDTGDLLHRMFGGAATAVGRSRSALLRVAAIGTIVVELIIAAGYLRARYLDSAGRPTRAWCWVAWVLAVSLHSGFELMGLQVGWFSRYMIFMACVFFLPEPILATVVRLIGVPVERLEKLSNGVVGRLDSGAASIGLGLLVAAVFVIAGLRVDIPGTSVAFLVAAIVTLAPAFVWVARGELAPARARMLASGLVAVVAWLAVSAAQLDYHAYRAVDLMARGHDDEALVALMTALDHAPASGRRTAELRYDVGALHKRSGRLEDAVTWSRRAIDASPDWASAHNVLGATLGSLGDVDGAIVHFERALQLEPDHAEARQNLALARQMRARR